MGYNDQTEAATMQSCVEASEELERALKYAAEKAKMLADRLAEDGRSTHDLGHVRMYLQATRDYAGACTTGLYAKLEGSSDEG